MKSKKCQLSLIHVLGLGLDLHVLGLGLGLGLCVLGLEKTLKSLALASTLRSLALLQHCFVYLKNDSSSPQKGSSFIPTKSCNWRIKRAADCCYMHSSVRASAVLRAGLKSIMLSHFKLILLMVQKPSST